MKILFILNVILLHIIFTLQHEYQNINQKAFWCEPSHVKAQHHKIKVIAQQVSKSSDPVQYTWVQLLLSCISSTELPRNCSLYNKTVHSASINLKYCIILFLPILPCHSHNLHTPPCTCELTLRKVWWTSNLIVSYTEAIPALMVGIFKFLMLIMAMFETM